MSPPKYETKDRSRYIEEYAKLEKNIERKRPYNGIYSPSSKAEVKEYSNRIEENSKSKNEEIF